MTITALPTPPSRQDPTNFNDRADAFLGALPQFQSEANALQTDVNNKQIACATSEANAAASALASANTANTSIWVSGTTYAIGANRFSPINFLTYRRKTNGAGTTDPSLDSTNWQLLTGLGDTTLSAVYPVGSIYINASNPANPNTIFGFGTWVAFGAGRVMVGFDSADALFNAAEKTGGSADAIVVSHSHTASSSVTDPGHTHYYTASFDGNSRVGPYPTVSDQGQYGNNNVSTSSTGISVGTTVNATGSSGTNANLPPYITVYMWKRTA